MTDSPNPRLLLRRRNILLLLVLLSVVLAAAQTTSIRRGNQQRSSATEPQSNVPAGPNALPQNISGGNTSFVQNSTRPATPSPDQANPVSRGAEGRAVAKHFLTDFEFWLSLEVLLFGAAVVIVEFLLLRRHGVTAEEALRVYAITVIIIGALFTVTAGFDNVSVAPAFGLLGTVAGYILGRRVSPPEAPPTSTAQEK